MSTRSMIGIKINDTEGKFIYCHNDGYPEFVGRILKNHYNDINKVNELLSLGDISSLGSKIYPDPSKPHTFMNRQRDTVVAYHRDRGDDFDENRVLPLATVSAAEGNDLFDIDYFYIFDPEKEKWFVNDNTNNNWEDLNLII